MKSPISRAISWLIIFLFSFGKLHAQHWRTTGNGATPFADQPTMTKNIIGTGVNIPIRFQTNGVNRMKLNQNVNYQVNDYPGPLKSGYLLLGSDGNLGSGGTLYQTKGAFSLLHLNGPGSFVQEAGYRPWMQTGVTFTSSSDLMYVGQLSRSNDQTDAVITWSDNSGSGFGPDNLRFIFTNNTAAAQNFPSYMPDSYYGREVIRATGYGLVGIG